MAAQAEVLSRLPVGWATVYDGVPAGPGETAVARVVVGPGGIFVIDTHDWSGTATVVENVLLEDGRSRQADADRCLDQALVVAEMAAPFVEFVVPVVCVLADEPLLGWAVEVRVCSSASLTDALTGGPVVLADDDVVRAVALLSGDLEVDDPEQQPEPEPEPERRTESRRRRAAAVEPVAEPVPEQVADEVPDEAPRAATPGRSRRLPVVRLLVGVVAVAAMVLAGPQAVTSVREVVSVELGHHVGQACPTPAAVVRTPAPRAAHTQAGARKRHTHHTRHAPRKPVAATPQTTQALADAPC